MKDYSSNKCICDCSAYFITILGINVTTGFVAPYTSVVMCIPSKPLTPKPKDSAFASSVGVTISAAVLLTAVTVTACAITRVLIRRRLLQMYVRNKIINQACGAM